MSGLGHVHTLNLSRCDGIIDLSALGHVHTLDLSECRCECAYIESILLPRHHGCECLGPCAYIESKERSLHT